MWAMGLLFLINFSIYVYIGKKSKKLLYQLANFNQTKWYNHPWVKEIQVSSIKGPGSFQRGDYHKMQK
jgi:hypothetical protein